MSPCRCFGWGGGGRAGNAPAAGASAALEPRLPRTELPLALARPGQRAGAPPPLRVLSWNILADGLAQHGDFVNAPPEVLAWEYRLPRIVREIAEARPDIVALQEANHYGAGAARCGGRTRSVAVAKGAKARRAATADARRGCPTPPPPSSRPTTPPDATRPADELAAALKPLGLVGHWLPKRPAPPERYGAPPDGTALFYRAARLAPIEGPRGAPYARPGGGGGMTQGFVIATLRDTAAAGRPVVVAATHLKAKEGGPNEETRRLQVCPGRSASGVPHPPRGRGAGRAAFVAAASSARLPARRPPTRTPRPPRRAGAAASAARGSGARRRARGPSRGRRFGDGRLQHHPRQPHMLRARAPTGTRAAEHLVGPVGRRRRKRQRQRSGQQRRRGGGGSGGRRHGPP